MIEAPAPSGACSRSKSKSFPSSNSLCVYTAYQNIPEIQNRLWLYNVSCSLWVGSTCLIHSSILKQGGVHQMTTGGGREVYIRASSGSGASHPIVRPWLKVWGSQQLHENKWQEEGKRRGVYVSTLHLYKEARFTTGHITVLGTQSQYSECRPAVSSLLHVFPIPLLKLFFSCTVLSEWNTREVFDHILLN